MLANDECKITDTYTYDAFGNLISSTGDTVNDFLYRGEQFDSFTGLYYLRARYINPSTGTFITMDEYAGSIFEPVSLHKYLYANANPVMYSDPSGYSSLGEMAATTAIIGVLSGITTAAIRIATFIGEGGQWGDIDWGSVLLEALGGACIGAIFGAAGWYAQFAQSAIIMYALGGASITSAALSAIQGCIYGQQGNSELSALYWLLSILGFTGGCRAIAGARAISSANATAATTTNNSASNTSKADTLAQNKKVGGLFENYNFDLLKESTNFSNVEKQITIAVKTDTGIVKVRVDAAALNSDGKVVLFDFKSSSTATLTTNQKIAYPIIEKSGGVVVGNGKGIFRNGYAIEPTKVNIIRPK